MHLQLIHCKANKVEINLQWSIFVNHKGCQVIQDWLLVQLHKLVSANLLNVKSNI